MQTMILEIDTSFNPSALRGLSGFLKTLPYIKSVTIEPPAGKPAKLSDEDWIKPGRPATDEDMEQMIVDSMKGKGIPAEISRKRTLKKFAQWRKKISK